jgi:calcium permeable stress-gated cation channel
VQLAQTSIYASLGTSIGFTALLAIGFSLLRPYNSVVYAPKLKIADEKHAPPPMGKGMFAWVGPVLKTKEQDLVTLIGLDATVFLRVLRMCRNIFLSLSAVGCGILIPLNLAKGTEKHVTIITKVSAINTFGQANWAITIVAWLFNIVLAGFLWYNYRAVLKLRRQYYETPEYQASLHARTLMVSRGSVCIVLG